MKDRNVVRIVSQGKRADIGMYKIDRILPNRMIDAVGPFVFLDYLLPTRHELNSVAKAEGTGPHPHRGIATLTYVLKGVAEHYDSRGNHALVRSGGIQWMKAGNGIVHDESISVDQDAGDPLTQSLQFWINLPGKIKVEEPEYLAVAADKIPEIDLGEQGGWLKVIAGDFRQGKSSIPSYSPQFVYHLHLNGERSFSLPTLEAYEYGALLIGDAVVNDHAYPAGDFLLFDRHEGEIEIKNASQSSVDVIIFGGARYTEPIVAAGPFVMNTEHEISIAYNDFYDGRYGEINYVK